MKKYKIKVDGRVYEVEVEEISENKVSISSGKFTTSPPVVAKTAEEVAKPEPPRSAKSPVPAKEPAAAVTGEEVVAPMPGKILQLRVSEGNTVKEGDTLLILEAMKMENEIVAGASGRVKKINVAVNDMVDTNDVLLVIG